MLETAMAITVNELRFLFINNSLIGIADDSPLKSFIFLNICSNKGRLFSPIRVYVDVIASRGVIPKIGKEASAEKNITANNVITDPIINNTGSMTCLTHLKPYTFY